MNSNCTACGECGKAVQTEIADAFNYNLGKVKAAYLPSDYAYPQRYVIDASIVGTADGEAAKAHFGRKLGITWNGADDITLVTELSEWLQQNQIDMTLWFRGLAPLVVTTGGKRPDDRFTEAGASASYLEERGVPAAAIVQVGDQILLARNAAWKGRRFALITGFMEAGESLEGAARRELREETGLTLEKATLQELGRAKRVEIGKDHIRRGDVFQVVLSQRLRRAFAASPLSLYRTMIVIRMVEERLAAEGLVVPEPVVPLAAYVPAARTGSLVFTAGQLPFIEGALPATGKVGAEVSPDQAYEAARLTALGMLTSLKHELGDLDRITHRLSPSPLIALITI